MSFQSKNAPSIAVFDPEWWKVALALFAALLLQTTLLPHLQLRGGQLSLVLLVLLWFALHAGPWRGAYFGLLAGICEDALASTGIAWTFADAAIGAVAGALGRTLLGDSVLLAPPMVALLTLLRYLFFLTFLRAENGPILFAPHWHAVFWQSAFNALAALGALVVATRFEVPYGNRGR